MKRIYILLFIVLVAVGASAQMRGRIQNTTQYSEVANAKARRIGTRASAALPCTGSPKIPVILVQFSDLKFMSTDSVKYEPNERYDKFFNGTGIDGQRYTEAGSYSAVRDYFINQSDSLFKPDFKVIGPVTLNKSYAFYGKGKYSDPNISYFYTEACKQAMAEYNVDWNDFDNNKDGITDFVFFIYAGEGETGSKDVNTIWPKEGTNNFTVKVDDQSIVFGGYGCTCEVFNGDMDGIGSCCHELSHALGLPDLYDTTSEGTCYGMDYWDIMDSGCYTLNGLCPTSYSAYEREFMGWRSMETVEYDDALTLTIKPIEKPGNKAYKILNPGNNNEYFILENRQNVENDKFLGYFRKDLGKAHGLLIYHIDYNSSRWTSNVINTLATHQYFTIVPADGTLYSEMLVTSTDMLPEYVASLHGDTYPGEANVTEMSSYAVYKGGTIKMKIDNIKESEDGIITLDMNGGHSATIVCVKDDSANDGKIYDLSGRRIDAPAHGLYIKNGKKYLVK